jgi:hypothetical protein
VKSISIDTSDLVFADLFPCREAIREAIVTTGRFKSCDIEWMTDIATTRISSGMSFKGTVQEIVRSGETLAPHMLKALGLNSRRKIGIRFIEAIAIGDVNEAVEALDLTLHTETSKASQLHNLNRMRNAGVKFCKLLGPGEGVNLPLEADLSGQRLSIEEAIDLVESRATEIRRSVFMAEVKF